MPIPSSVEEAVSRDNDLQIYVLYASYIDKDKWFLNIFARDPKEKSDFYPGPKGSENSSVYGLIDQLFSQLFKHLNVWKCRNEVL